ncbi:hypothetical protein Cde04nite_35570 [Cellulomonas denverensis]|nr:hypothetical protein Cde04nite_35570 [Cellulomonas denverensis]
MSSPVIPELVIVTMTIDPIDPSIGSIDVSIELLPSLVDSSGGGSRVITPDGTRGAADRCGVLTAATPPTRR